MTAGVIDVVICGPGRNGEPPAELLASRDVGVRWCFVERARHLFVDELFGSREPSHYEPTWTRRCSSCRGIDVDLGFGWTREWGEP